MSFRQKEETLNSGGGTRLQPSKWGKGELKVFAFSQRKMDRARGKVFKRMEKGGGKRGVLVGNQRKEWKLRSVRRINHNTVRKEER